MSKARNAVRALLAAGLFAMGLGAHAQSKAPPATVRVATIPIPNFTQLMVARDKGYFAEENLNVTWTSIAQGAVAVEAVYGGSAEFGGTGILEPMIARGNGLDVMFAVGSARIDTKPPGASAVMVRNADPIRRPADLAGKTISVGLINSINYIHMVEWLRKHGVDAKTVRFVEIPFPQMADALFQNRLDAVWNVEPFLTFMKRTGNARNIGEPLTDNLPGMDITAFVAKESWLKANGDVARRFKRAMDRATAHLVGAPKEERDGWVAKFTGAKPEVVSQINLVLFTSEFNIPSLRANLELAAGQKVVKSFDVNAMVWKP